MIVDALAHADLYAPLGRRFERALAACRDPGLASSPCGAYELEGRDVVALVQAYDTVPRAQAAWEAHRSHLDVHVVLAGSEAIGFADATAMRAISAYHEADDVVLLAGGDGDEAALVPGRFAVCFPHDAHRPRLAVGAPAPVRKLVIKVAWPASHRIGASA